MMSKSSPARLRVNARTRPGDHSLCFEQFGLACKVGLKVILWCRISIQDNRYHLIPQLVELLGECERRGATIIGIFYYVGNGSATDIFWQVHAEGVAAFARQQKAIVLAAEPDRFVRNRYWTPERFDWEPIEEDLAIVRRYFRGVTLMTLTPPHISPGEARSRQTIRGLQEWLKSKKGLRSRLQPIAIAMSKAGISIRAIAGFLLLGKGKSTVSEWISKPNDVRCPDLVFQWELP